MTSKYNKGLPANAVTQDFEELFPAQRKAAERIMDLLPCSGIVLITAPSGGGMTTLLTALHKRLGGMLITDSVLLNEALKFGPLSFFEAAAKMFQAALKENDLIIVDTLPFRNILESEAYPLRGGICELILSDVVKCAHANNKRIIWGSNGFRYSDLTSWGHTLQLGHYQSEDYGFLFHSFLSEQAEEIDVDLIFKFASGLTAHDIRKACEVVRNKGIVSTEALVEYLKREGLYSNVSLDEVEDVQVEGIKGLDDVMFELDRKVIFPLTRNELSEQFQFQPVRGVVLYGPPGTGKTSIGRYLAHRLCGKFFLLDGRNGGDLEGMRMAASRIFERARRNAPSVVFIDDFDAVLSYGGQHPLYQFLLSELDGLENCPRGTVCVMMTVMEVEKLPPALVRSGRMELWLETHLPDESVRLDILQDRISALPEPLSQASIPELAQMTDGFNGADLSSIVEHTKMLYGYDRVNRRPVLTPDQYFRMATEAAREHKKNKAISGFSGGKRGRVA